MTHLTHEEDALVDVLVERVIGVFRGWSLTAEQAAVLTSRLMPKLAETIAICTKPNLNKNKQENK